MSSISATTEHAGVHRLATITWLVLSAAVIVLLAGAYILGRVTDSGRTHTVRVPAATQPTVANVPPPVCHIGGEC